MKVGKEMFLSCAADTDRLIMRSIGAHVQGIERSVGNSIVHAVEDNLKNEMTILRMSR